MVSPGELIRGLRREERGTWLIGTVVVPPPRSGVLPSGCSGSSMASSSGPRMTAAHRTGLAGQAAQHFLSWRTVAEMAGAGAGA